MSRSRDKDKAHGLRGRGAGMDLALLLGVGVSTLLAFLTSMSIPTSVVLGLLVGLVGATTTLQIDTLLRLEKRFNADDSRLMLLKAVEGAPEYLPSLTEIAMALGEAGNRYPTHAEFAEAARDVVETARAQLVGLSDGRLRTDDGNTRWMLAKLESCKQSVHATSVDDDLAWWTSPSGTLYLEHNRALVARGGTVQRIFLLNRATPEIHEVLRAQKDAGIEVFVVPEPLGVPATLMRNLAIYDQSYLVEDEVNALGQVTGYLHTLNPSDVNGAIQAFERLRTLSRPYVPSTAVAGSLTAPDVVA